ncbi:mechanosensitive ion channel family protein [uncultured Gordonia sp.]|uniref:mechanosensitive ion channel family protein n=1 Tax=uncultured Gordonia sp. TaxID=198437 RepID=UPI00258DB1AD|nr:mechanosensitive ion channel family protein [uncultured Gordonia sp.]
MDLSTLGAAHGPITQLAFEWTDTNRMWLVERPIRIVCYIVGALIVRWVAHRLIDRATRGNPDGADRRAPALIRHLRERSPTGAKTPAATKAAVAQRRYQRARTIGSVLKSTVSIIVLTWAALAILSVLGVNIAPFIASAGVIGLAVGFGAQNLVRDFVTGVFMLLEDQYGVGDTVDLGEAIGTVESVGLRITTVRDVDGTLWYVRNGEIARVGNMSQEYAVARVEVPVSLRADLDRAQEVALDAAMRAVADDETLAADVVDEPRMLGVQEVASDRVVLRLTVTTRPNAQWAVQRRLRREILRAYDEHDIDLPYVGGRTLVGADADG